MSNLSITRKDKAQTKISMMIQNGRKEISSYDELKKYQRGSLISYITHTGIFRYGGFLLKVSPENFIYLTPDFSQKRRAYFKSVSKMWLGNVNEVNNDIVSLKQSSQRESNFPVNVNNTVIYYGNSTYDRVRFLNTDRYKKIIQWYKYFVDPDFDNDQLKGKNMDKKQLSLALAKYDISHNELKKILKHLSYFKENIDVTVPNKIGDEMNLSIGIEFVFDDKGYDISFDVDYSGNKGHWTWDDDYQAEDEDEPQYVLRTYICNYLDRVYGR